MTFVVTFDAAVRATEILLALAILQQSAEHMVGPRSEQVLFGLRIPFATLLLAGVAAPMALVALLGLSLAGLRHFQGPYNGGSDRMGLLILACLTGAHLLPTAELQHLAFGYLAVQVVLSYFISGQVKLFNPDWRNGTALRDVFAFSAYPVSEDLRGLARRTDQLRFASWAVIGFEVAFPLALYSQPVLIAALTVAAGFHLSNALLFGLNRFVWIWIAAYPSLFWLQQRMMGVW